MQRWLRISDMLLCCCGIAALALTSADFIRHKLATQRQRPAAAGEVHRPSATQPLESYAAIMEQGLFGPACQGRLTPLSPPDAVRKTAQPAGAVSQLQGDLTLVGTVCGSGRSAFAIIRKNSSGEERPWRVGEPVFGGARLAAVRRQSAVLSAGRERITLTTPDAAPATAVAVPRMALGGAPAMEMGSSRSSYQLDQRVLNAALDNIGQTMTEARLLPSTTNGKVEGLRASEVKPGGIFAAIGVRNGDVLQRVNDYPVDAPDKALQTLAALRGQNRIKLDLIREGRPLSLSYDIR